MSACGGPDLYWICTGTGLPACAARDAVGHACGRRQVARILVAVDELDLGWRPGDHILVDLPDGQTVRCRIMNIKDDGSIQVVPDHEVVVQARTEPS